MKVLQINSVCGIRSTGRICTDLAEVLRENGHESLICYGRMAAPQSFSESSYRITSDLGVKLDGLFTRLSDRAGFFSRRATEKLIQTIREYEPDVIHLHNLHGYYVNIDLLFRFLGEYGKPVVWTLHDCWPFTGHCTHFAVAGCERWKTLCRDCPSKKNYPQSLFFDNSEKNYKDKKMLFSLPENLTLVTPSQWLKGLAEESFLGNRPAFVIPNGIDTEVFTPTKSDFRTRFGLEKKKIVLGVAISWYTEKGILEFFELSRILPEEYQVVLVGLKEEQRREAPESVLALPPTNSAKELAEIYSAADVFINPSRQETMGLTTVEAMACGTCVITSAYTAVPEVVRPAGGLVARDVSPETLAELITKTDFSAFSDPRSVALAYDKKVSYQKYLELYQKQIQG